MARSLKERYESRKVSLLKERLVVVDKQLIEENRVATLILEAMDQEDLDKVSAIVDKMERIRDAAGKDKNLQVLVNAIDQALQDVNKYAGGGPISAAWNKLKAKVGGDNPIVKVTTLASALESGFKQLPQILRNNGIDLKKLSADGTNITLRDAIARQLDGQNKVEKVGEDSQGGFGGKSGTKPAAGSTSQPSSNNGPPSIDAKDIDAMDKSDKSPEAAKKLKIVIDQIRKALAPAGIFGAFKKIPYVDGAALAQALANADIGVLNTIAQAVKSGAQSGEVAPDLKANITGQGGAETKGTQPADPGQSTSGSQPSSPDKQTNPAGTSSTPAGETPSSPRGGASAPSKPKGTKLEDAAVQDLAQFIAKKTKLDPQAVLKVVAALNASEKLREGLKR